MNAVHAFLKIFFLQEKECKRYKANEIKANFIAEKDRANELVGTRINGNTIFLFISDESFGTNAIGTAAPQSVARIRFWIAASSLARIIAFYWHFILSAGALISANATATQLFSNVSFLTNAWGSTTGKRGARLSVWFLTSLWTCDNTFGSNLIASANRETCSEIELVKSLKVSSVTYIFSLQLQLKLEAKHQESWFKTCMKLFKRIRNSPASSATKRIILESISKVCPQLSKFRI